MASPTTRNTSTDYTQHTEPSTSQSAAVANIPMTPVEFERSLTAWARDAGPNENRFEAKIRMLEAYDQEAPMLSLHGLSLTSLPESIGQLSNLEVLRLDNNRLQSLPESIGNLSNLQKLYLDKNQLESLPESIGQLSNLQTLFLWSNQLTSLPERIGQLSNLEELRLWNNQLTSLPESIGQLSKLKELYLGNNQLQSLPKSIGQLSNLKELRLWNNQLQSLPESIGQLSNLQTLFLWSNQLTSLPESVGQLSNLQELVLRYNQLQSLPESIGQLSNLKELVLRYNQLQSLPESIGQLSNLKELYLDNNRLQSLPKSIGQLSNLEVLRLWNNQLTHLPKSLQDFWGKRKFGNETLKKRYGKVKYFDPNSITQPSTSNTSTDYTQHAETSTSQTAGAASMTMTPVEFEQSLTAWARDAGPNENRFEATDRILKAYEQEAPTLDLSGLNLTSLPERIDDLSNLQELDLTFNQLTSLPESIGQLGKLKKLGLAPNRLQSLPESIGQLSNLEELSLAPNRLQSLPENIGKLSNLQELDLTLNQLTSLPESIGRLSKLKKLNLYKNPLQSLPESIGRLSNLQELNLWNNQLTSLPESIGRLSNLQELDLTFNPLQSLPESIGRLSKLKKLNLIGNKLTSLPRSLKNFWEIKEFGVFGDIVTCRKMYGNVQYFDPISTAKASTSKTSWWGRNPNKPAQASTSTAPATTVESSPPPQVTPRLVAEPNETQIQDLPEGLQTALGQLRDMPLDQLKSFLSNDLSKIVSMPQLPPDLHNSEAHRNFFKGFTGLLNEHYFMLRSISVKAIEEEAPLWVQGISMALQGLSLPGTAVAGGLLNQTAKLMSQAQAEKKARKVIQQFASDLHFTVTAHQAGVLFTQHMEHVPEITLSFLKQAKPLFKKLGEKAKLLSHNPYEDMPEVLDAYTLFLKTVKTHPEIMDAVHESNLSFQEHCETAATRLVSKGLGFAIDLPKAEGSSHSGSSTHRQEVEFVEVPEAPDSEPAESSEVQQLKGKVAELESLMKQLLENGNAGGMAVAQTLRHMEGVGGEVYASIAESSTAAEHRLRTHSLQINELRQELFANMAPAVHRHEQDLHAIKAPDTEFTNLKDMVTASAHYLRRFGVINYANTPITVRLADGREVDLADKLKKLHDKQPRASLKPYRPRVELQSLIAELAEEVSNRADLDLEGGKRKLGAVVAQRTREDKVYTHNTDVVKMASYYLRRFGLVNYASGETKIQLADQEGEVSVAQALADIHHSLPNSSRKQYRLQHLLEHLVMKLPDEVKDALDLELDENAALLSRLQENMALKRDPRLPVSLREMARQAQERQRLLGT